MKRNSFILHLDSLKVLDKLSDEQAGKLFKAIYHYHIEKDYSLDFALEMAFLPFENQFERDEVKYEKVVNRNRSNGSKGGRPKKPKETEKTQSVLKEPKKADSDSVSDSDSVNDSVSIKDNTRGVSKKETPKRKVFKPPSLEELKNYCNERSNNVNAQQWLDHYTSNGWMVGKNKMKDWKAAVRTWERNNINNNTNGGFKQNTSRGATRTHMQRQDYD